MFSVPQTVETLLRHDDTRAECLRGASITLRCELSIYRHSAPDASKTRPWEISLHVGETDAEPLARIIRFRDFDRVVRFLVTGETDGREEVAYFDAANKLVKKEGRVSPEAN